MRQLAGFRQPRPVHGGSRIRKGHISDRTVRKFRFADLNAQGRLRPARRFAGWSVPPGTRRRDFSGFATGPNCPAFRPLFRDAVLAIFA
jgi:hypothetical protein